MVLQGNNPHVLLQAEMNRHKNKPLHRIDYPKLVQNEASIQQRKRQYFLGVLGLMRQMNMECELGNPKDMDICNRVGGFGPGQRVSVRSRDFFFLFCVFLDGLVHLCVMT